MSVSITCSWCHTVNDSFQRWCKTCSHSAWLPRLDCDCRKCLGVLFLIPPPTRVEAELLPLPPAIRRLLGDADLEDDTDDQDSGPTA